MTPTHYSLIRYIGDLARGEALNVGIVAWTADQCELRLDPGALARVIRENPHLAPDALNSLEARLQRRLAGPVPEPDAELPRRLSDRRGFPVVLTEARASQVRDGETLRQTVDRLLEHLVRPRTRAAPDTV